MTNVARASLEGAVGKSEGDLDCEGEIHCGTPKRTSSGIPDPQLPVVPKRLFQTHMMHTGKRKG